MKEGWEKKKLGEVAEIEYGTRVVQKKDGGTLYPVYGGGGATFRMDTYNREDRMVIARFAMSPQCTRYVNGKFFLNDSGLTVSPNNKELKQDYLDRALFSLNNKIYSLGKGAAQKNLDMKAFKEMLIPVPPLSVQESIVSELDMLSGIISKHKALQEEYDRLEQSIFYDMFGDPVTNEKGWEVKKLGEVCKAQNGLVDPNAEPYCEMYHVGPANIVSNTSEIIDLKKAKEENFISGKYPFKKDMILYSKIRPNLNKVAIAPFDGVCSADMYPLICNDTIIPIVLLDNLKQDCFIKYANEHSGRANIPKINREALMEYKFPVPPLSLQQSFADKISAIEQMKAKNKAAQKEAEMLFNERMAYYF